MKLVHHQENWVRNAAVWSLGRLADPRVADILLDVLQNEQWDRLTKRGAVQGLVQIGDSRAIQSLVDLFIDFADQWHPDHDTWVVDALIKLNGVDQLVMRLLTELSHESTSFVSARNISALGKLGDKRAIDTLVKLRQQATGDVKRAIDDALLKLGYSDQETT
jgi:HEAT repeat protein